MSTKLIWITPDAEKLLGYIARVSNPQNQGNDNVEGLLRYMVKHQHWSPFEMASAVFEMTKVATKNWAGDVLAGTLMPLAIVHGVTPGNIVTIEAPKLQFNQEPSLNDDDKTAMLSANFAVMPDAGNDELVLTFT